MKYVRIILTGILLCTLTGCLSWWEGSSRLNTPEAIYARGQEKYQEGDYKEAIELFQRVAEQYPLHACAIPAELGVADSYFSDGAYDSAEANYTDFAEFHPANEHLPYVLYQIGLCHFKQVEEIDRDQTKTRMAEQAFQTLLSRFPSSKFSFLAEEKLTECRKMLGEHEFYVGRFYFTLGKYRAALGRIKVVEKNYAHLGMDYKTGYFIREAEKRLAQEDSAKENTH